MPGIDTENPIAEGGDWAGQVYWMGGSPCAGKSSVARVLAKCHNLQLYSIDAMFESHRKRFSVAEQPTLVKWTTTAWDELWMQPQPVLLAEAIACYSEHFELVIDDLKTRPTENPTLVEGNVLLPQKVIRFNAPTTHSIWITPTSSFQRRHYPQRGTWVQSILNQCRRPQAALQNWMDRDVAFAEWIIAETGRLNLSHLQVDGSRTITENAERVASLWQLAR